MRVGLIGANAVAELAIEIGKMLPEKIEFVIIDDNKLKQGEKFKGYTIETLSKDLFESEIVIDAATICFGENLMKLKVNYYQKLKHIGISFMNFMHPSIIKFDNTLIGLGNVIGAGVVLGFDTSIGNNTIIFGGAVIEHNSIISDHCYIGPNVTVSGFCEIGEGTLIGSGATILPEIKIGKFCKIGAGAVVTDHIDDFSTVVGVPARKINVN